MLGVPLTGAEEAAQRAAPWAVQRRQGHLLAAAAAYALDDAHGLGRTVAHAHLPFTRRLAAARLVRAGGPIKLMEELALRRLPEANLAGEAGDDSGDEAAKRNPGTACVACARNHRPTQTTTDHFP